jgi:cytochrome c-type biogenesis protein CcmF
MGIFFFFHKNKDIKSNKIFWLSKETSILINNWFMMYFLSVVLIGTVYPIFLDVISSEKISVGPPFYHKLIIPFLIPFLIFMALGSQLKWIKSGLQGKLYLVTLFIISLLMSFLIVKNLDKNFLINTVLIGSAFYLFLITIRDFFLKKFENLEQNVAHFGFSLLILSILFNNIFSNELITNLKVGESFKNEKFEITFIDLKKFKEKNYISFRGNFSIKENKKKEDRLEPELRVYNQPNIITSEADIKTTFFTDKFITINTVQNEEYFNIRYQVKPFMFWIWVSVLLISLGGLISLFKKKYEN